MIMASPDAFCAELGEQLWLIGRQIRPSDAVLDRIIDHLADQFPASRDEARADLKEFVQGPRSLERSGAIFGAHNHLALDSG
jgi:hypothetical protein